MWPRHAYVYAGDADDLWGGPQQGKATALPVISDSPRSLTALPVISPPGAAARVGAEVRGAPSRLNVSETETKIGQETEKTGSQSSIQFWQKQEAQVLRLWRVLCL